MPRTDPGEGIEIQIGQIPFDHVEVLARRDDLLVLEIETGSKYAGTWGCGWSDRQRLDFFASDHTLYAEDTHEPTVITLPLGMKDWVSYVDWRRYTLRVVAHPRQMGERHRIWSGE